MSNANEVEDLDFKWGIKRRMGGKKRDVQFYESFSFDGEEYQLFDSVYLYKDGEDEPYIGKLIKIWENADKTRRVKVLWFFRPSEIVNYLASEKVLKNELFLAAGEGKGLANVNPLEAIAGKCNVLCTSKEHGNQQPSIEEIEAADFVYYRVFDVGRCAISEKMEEKIAGIEVKFLLNKASPKPIINPKPIVDPNVVTTNQKIILANKDEVEACKIDKDVDGVIHASLIEGTNPKMNRLNIVLGETNTSNQVDLRVKEKVSKARCVSLKGPTGQRQDPNGLKDWSPKNLNPNASLKILERKGMQASTHVGRVSPKMPIVEAQNPDKVRVMEGKPSKKAKLDTSMRVSEGKGMQALAHISNPHDSKKVVRKADLSTGNFDLKHPKLTNEPHSIKVQESKSIPMPLQVFRRPQIDKSRWFGGIVWDERLRTARERGAVVLLQNLDRSYASADVEDIIWHAFKEYCTAKMIQRSTFSSPHNGQALAIFKTREAAENVLVKLDEECLMLSSGRPLIGSFAPPLLPGNQLTFAGHYIINRLRSQMQREMREAVSTSHCSQSNTMEFEMAMEWCLLQERMDYCWNNLFKLQGAELRKLKATLKSK